MAGAAGIEPAIMVLETIVIPFNYAPIPLQLYKISQPNARRFSVFSNIWYNYDIKGCDIMVRPYKDCDLDIIMKIWLDTNIQAHDFVNKDYWKNNYDYVKQLLPSSNLFIYDDGQIKGFAGVLDNGYIAGIFVSEKYQHCGIGQQLLDQIIKSFNVISLDVYKKNKQALNFYLKNGFIISETKKDENNETEYTMIKTS